MVGAVSQRRSSAYMRRGEDPVANPPERLSPARAGTDGGRQELACLCGARRQAPTGDFTCVAWGGGRSRFLTAIVGGYTETKNSVANWSWLLPEISHASHGGGGRSRFPTAIVGVHTATRMSNMEYIIPVRTAWPGGRDDAY